MQSDADPWKNPKKFIPNETEWTEYPNGTQRLLEVAYLRGEN